MNQIKKLFYYYLILSIIFWSGRFYIIKAYNMEQGPVSKEAYSKLLDWVGVFSYLYIVPLLIAGLISIIGFSRRNLTLTLNISISVLYVIIAAGVGIAFNFIFILQFYGFAP